MKEEAGLYQITATFQILKMLFYPCELEVFCIFFPGTVRLEMKWWDCCWKRQVPQRRLLTSFCCVRFHRLIWEGAMGPLPWW